MNETSMKLDFNLVLYFDEVAFLILQEHSNLGRGYCVINVIFNNFVNKIEIKFKIKE